MNWTLLDTAESVAQAGCMRILSAAKEAIAQRGAFHLVLAGGTTPIRTYELLAQSESDWEHWHIYFGDERCLPPSNPERNSQMAALALTSKVAIPTEQIHPIPAELGAEAGAEQYSHTVAKAMPFDLVLLGMGEDGHTASLFPEQSQPENSLAVPVFNAPKPPPERVSLNYLTLNNCRTLLYLIAGASKHDAFSKWKHGVLLPISEINPMGESEILIDKAAAIGHI